MSESKDPEFDADESANMFVDLSESIEHWERVREKRFELAESLGQMSANGGDIERRQLRSVIQWLKGSATWDDALRRPDVLAICLPLLDAIKEGRSLSDGQVRQAARSGFCGLGQNGCAQTGIIRRIFYPILVLVGCGLLAIFFSFALIPQFEQMFNEFGIELPSMTKLIFGVAAFIRLTWWIIVGFVVLATIALLVMNNANRHTRPAGMTWLDQRLMSSRNALALWAWHLSWLLRAGLTQSQALIVAGESTGKEWIRQNSFARAKQPSTPHDPTEDAFAEPPEVSGTKNPPVNLMPPRYQLINCALHSPTGRDQMRGKIVLLREIAAIYWDRSRNMGDWWIKLLMGMFCWGVGGVVLLFVVSLLAPMLAIIGGLTGSTIGGLTGSIIGGLAGY